MSFTSDQLTIVIVLLLFIIVISLLVKQFIKIAIVVVLILAIFKLGFVLTGADGNLSETGKEVKETIASLGQQELYDAFMDGVGDTIDVVKDKTIEINYDEFSRMIAESLVKIKQQNIENGQLSKIISEEFENFNTEEIRLIVDKTRYILNSMKLE